MESNAVLSWVHTGHKSIRQKLANLWPMCTVSQSLRKLVLGLASVKQACWKSSIQSALAVRSGRDAVPPCWNTKHSRGDLLTKIACVSIVIFFFFIQLVGLNDKTTSYMYPALHSSVSVLEAHSAKKHWRLQRRTSALKPTILLLTLGIGKKGL